MAKLPIVSGTEAVKALERFKKYCSRVERGFLGLGEALAKAQVSENPVTEPKRSPNQKRPLPFFFPATRLQYCLNRSRLRGQSPHAAARWSRKENRPQAKCSRPGPFKASLAIPGRDPAPRRNPAISHRRGRSHTRPHNPEKTGIGLRILHLNFSRFDVLLLA